MTKTYLLIALIVLFMTSCNSGKIPKDAKIVAPISSTSTPKGSFLLADFSLEIPAGWEEMAAANTMRVTQFQMQAHPEYELVISYFGNNADMVDENIARWRGQFTKEDSYGILSLKSSGPTGVKILGTFKTKPFPMAQEFTESADYGMLAAILPSKDGPYFIKLTAPEAIIEEAEASFVELLDSYKR
ncbi:MAG: hypothetical protein ACERKD_05760 [Prolixibacteraceae bacterium]